jgi:hypothetical protein
MEQELETILIIEQCGTLCVMVVIALYPGYFLVLEQWIAEPCYMINISFIDPFDKLSTPDITIWSWSKS